MGWIIFLIVLVPIIGVIGWLALDESFVRIEPGQLGLLLIRGRATDQVLDPGPHWVPALRRRMVQTYPSLELAYRAVADESVPPTGDLERSGPVLSAVLRDRTGVIAAYTVRFRLDIASVRMVHDRFGPEGIWAVVRDASEAALRAALGEAEVDDLYGDGRAPLESRLGEAVSAALAEVGLLVTMFHLGDIDLGRTGDVIEATSRARWELAREQAEAATRLARAQIDADLAPLATASGADLALRYREVDSWLELASQRNIVGPAPPARPPSPEAPAEPAVPPPSDEETR